MDKIPGGEIKVKNKFTVWFNNYWYHHKWATIGIAFAIFVLLVCTLQMCEREEADISVYYAGPDSFIEGEMQSNVEAALKAVLPEDYSGDGKKFVEWVSCFVLSEADIKTFQEEAREAGEDYYYNASMISDNIKNYQGTIMSGEYSLCFLSPYLYEMVKGADGFTPLSDIFDEVPSSAYDEYSIKLSDTEFGHYFPGISELSDDTLVCLRRKGGLGLLLRKDKSEKENAHAAELFRAIVAFVPEN